MRGKRAAAAGGGRRQSAFSAFRAIGGQIAKPAREWHCGKVESGPTRCGKRKGSGGASPSPTNAAGGGRRRRAFSAYRAIGGPIAKPAREWHGGKTDRTPRASGCIGPVQTPHVSPRPRLRARNESFLAILPVIFGEKAKFSGTFLAFCPCILQLIRI